MPNSSQGSGGGGGLVSAGIGALAGIANLVTSAINNKKAKREARELEATRPVREIPELAKQDLSLAESEVGGLSARGQQAYNQLQDKAISSSLGAILRGGGSTNNVGSVFGASEDGRLKLALMNDELRMNQIKNLSRARDQMIEEQDKNFMFNKVAPWRDKAQAVAAARQQAQNGIWSGIDTVAGSAMQYAGQKYNENQYNKYFAPSGNTGMSGTPAPITPTAARGNYSFNPPPPTMQGAPQLASRLTYPSNNDNVYNYNWSPEQEMNQYQNDFGLIYQ